MIIGDCLCQKNASFEKYFEFKNETVFKNYKGIIIGKCTNCGLLKTFPNKNLKHIPQPSRDLFYEKNRRFFEGLFRPVVDKITSYKKTGKVLDIGCSSGILLQLLKNKGFDVYGIEPDKKAYLTASKKFKAKIFFGFLEGFAKKTKNKFDIIIYNHVLEHIDDVLNEIKLSKSILNKNGILTIGVPNTGNIIFSLRKKYWESLMPNEHIWHFSTEYLVNLLKDQGFKILNVSFSDDKRLDYPFYKRLYFSVLSLINKLCHTGEAVLIIAFLDNNS